MKDLYCKRHHTHLHPPTPPPSTSFRNKRFKWRCQHWEDGQVSVNVFFSHSVGINSSSQLWLTRDGRVMNPKRKAQSMFIFFSSVTAATNPNSLTQPMTYGGAQSSKPISQMCPLSPIYLWLCALKGKRDLQCIWVKIFVQRLIHCWINQYGCCLSNVW